MNDLGAFVRRVLDGPWGLSAVVAAVVLVLWLVLATQQVDTPDFDLGDVTKELGGDAQSDDSFGSAVGDCGDDLDDFTAFPDRATKVRTSRSVEDARAFVQEARRLTGVIEDNLEQLKEVLEPQVQELETKIGRLDDAAKTQAGVAEAVDGGLFESTASQLVGLGPVVCG